MAKKHTAKWNALYKSTMKWQQKARAKERRLAAKGANNVGEVSPVKTPAELQNMTYSQLEKYRHSLNVFSDVNTKFVITPDKRAVSANSTVTLESGERIKWRRWQTLRNAVNKVNRQRSAMQSAMENVALPPAYDERRRYSTVRYDPYTGEKVQRTSEDSISGVVHGPSKLPKSTKDLNQMIGTYRRMGERGFDSVVEQARGNAIKIAGMLGWEGVALELEDMDPSVLAMAIEYFDLFGNLNLWYSDNMRLGDPFAGYYEPQDEDPIAFGEAEAALENNLRQYKRDLAGVKLPNL